MRLKWMLFGVALLQVCVLWNQFFGDSEWSLLILMGLEEKK